MSVHDSFSNLGASLSALDEALDALALLAGDLPESGDEPAVVEAIRDRVAAIRGSVHDASASVRAAKTLTDARSTRSVLSTAHAAFNDVARRVRSDLASSGNLIEIAVIGGRGGAWNRWRGEVEQALERTAASTDAIGTAMLECWRTLTNHDQRITEGDSSCRT